MRKLKGKLAKIAKRLSGISTPFGGLSWQPPTNQREIIRKLFTILEDRRVLYYDRHLEHGPWVTKSILEIRREITKILKKLPEGAEAIGSLKAMRAACRKFLDSSTKQESRKRNYFPLSENRWIALGELRASFGLHLAILCVAYELDAPDELAGLFPGEDK